MPVNHYWHPQTDEFRKMGAPLPEAKAHGTEDQIRERLQPVQVVEWKLQGNNLIGTTADGLKMCQQIPTDMILTGVDEDNRPILQKVELK